MRDFVVPLQRLIQLYHTEATPRLDPPCTSDRILSNGRATTSPHAPGVTWQPVALNTNTRLFRH
jgi:hypothetical protein